jgi:hypothetical protein
LIQKTIRQINIDSFLKSLFRKLEEYLEIKSTLLKTNENYPSLSIQITSSIVQKAQAAPFFFFFTPELGLPAGLLKLRSNPSRTIWFTLNFSGRLNVITKN